MVPILSFIGNSDSGKTTLLEGVVASLKQRDYKIAVIKHTHDFELEKEGKNSWRLSKAGADTVVVTSPEELAIMKKTDHDFTPQEISRLISGDVDVILTEGFKHGSAMKIEVHRKEQGKELIVPPDQLLAVVTDEPLNIKTPQFNPDDIDGLTQFIEKWLSEQTKDEIEMVANGVLIPLNKFVKKFIIETLVGMVSSLKGTDEIKSLRISLRRKP
jgi:molybdopterin-guanine dinucleotide biosynthesis adapter protein